MLRVLPGFSNWSLRGKMVTIIMASCAVCLFVSLSVMFVSSAVQRYQGALDELSSLVDVLAENGQAALLFSDRYEAQRLLKSLRQQKLVCSAWMVTTDGAVLASWNRGDVSRPLPTGYPVSERRLRTDLRALQVELFTPVYKYDEQIGYIVLQANFTVLLREQLGDLAVGITAAILALLIVYLLVIRLQRIVSRPIEELAEAANTVAENKNYALRAVSRTSDEIGDLVQAFNTMLGEIQQRDETLTRHRDRLEDEVMRRTGELREAKEAAEAAAAAKGMFLANMSHEIRTPLNAIIGLSDLAINGELSAKQRYYLQNIHSSSRTLLAMTNDILDFSKMEAGRMQLSIEQFVLEELLENVLNLFANGAEEKGLQLVLDMDPDMPRSLLGDRLRLGQVLNNLFGNAVKFTQVGKILLKIEQLERDDASATLHFTLLDTGIGMTAEQRTHLFEAFNQADGSISRRFGGTGLGLAISKQIVSLMGGDLRVSSEIGKGSEFSFMLRFALPDDVANDYRVDDLKPMRVLVVDAIDSCRDMLLRTLSAWDFQVEVADSAGMALSILKQAHSAGNGIDVVLLDFSLPDMDSLQLIAKLAALSASGEMGRVHVLMMLTTSDWEQLVNAAADLMPDDVLLKPLLPGKLLDAFIRLQGGDGLPALNRVKKLISAAVDDGLKGARVLVVDDNEINQVVVRDYLASAGLSVVVVENVNEGLAELKTSDQRFDAVLMDMHMPGVHGIDATRMIRQEPALSDLPVIAMTAALEELDRVACYEAGIDDYIDKPIDPGLLMKALRRWIKVEEAEATASSSLVTVDVSGGCLPARLPGFDLDAIRIMIDDNCHRYVRLLKRFQENFLDSTLRINRFLQTGKVELAIEHLHSLKGAAGVLGAVELSRAAARFEESLRSGEKVTENGAVFEKALHQSFQTIAGMTTSASVRINAAQCSNWRKASEIVAELRLLLDGCDFVPHELIENLKGELLEHSVLQLVRQIEKQVDNIDYQRALSTLIKLEDIIEQHLTSQTT